MFQTIVYHVIGRPTSEMNLQEQRMFVSEERFVSHLRTLRENGYIFLNLKEAEKRLEGRIESHSKELLITFDDGYLNTVDVAMPILKKEKVSATLAICGSYLLPETRENYEMHVDKNFASVKKLKQWINNGNYILAHTYSHFKLTHLTLDKCEKEIVSDLKSIEKHLGIVPQGIAYPYGSINEKVISIIKKYFQYGFATDMGKATSWENRYCLKRVSVESDCTDEKLLEMLS